MLGGKLRSAVVPPSLSPITYYTIQSHFMLCHVTHHKDTNTITSSHYAIPTQTSYSHHTITYITRTSVIPQVTYHSNSCIFHVSQLHHSHNEVLIHTVIRHSHTSYRSHTQRHSSYSPVHRYTMPYTCSPYTCSLSHVPIKNSLIR